MANIWHDVRKERINPDDFITVIEIPKGSKNKYELDKETGTIILDRILFTSMQYPANYGFIPKTISEDGDPLDVMVLCSEPLEPLVLVRCYPIGVVTMIDDGKHDEKIIAIPYKDPTYNSYKDLGDLPRHITDEIMHFLSVYKALEADRVTEVKDIQPRESAEEAIRIAKAKYEEIYG